MEWSAIIGILGFVAGAGATIYAAGKFQGGFIKRVETIEKFVNEYPAKEEAECVRCHDELIEEIRTNRREQQEQFGQLNIRLDKVISFRRRNGDGEKD